MKNSSPLEKKCTVSSAEKIGKGKKKKSSYSFAFNLFALCVIRVLCSEKKDHFYQPRKRGYNLFHLFG